MTIFFVMGYIGRDGEGRAIESTAVKLGRRMNERSRRSMKRVQTMSAVLAALGFSKEIVAVLAFSLWSMESILSKSKSEKYGQEILGIKRTFRRT